MKASTATLLFSFLVAVRWSTMETNAGFEDQDQASYMDLDLVVVDQAYPYQQQQPAAYQPAAYQPAAYPYPYLQQHRPVLTPPLPRSPLQQCQQCPQCRLERLLERPRGLSGTREQRPAASPLSGFTPPPPPRPLDSPPPPLSEPHFSEPREPPAVKYFSVQDKDTLPPRRLRPQCPRRASELKLNFTQSPQSPRRASVKLTLVQDKDKDKDKDKDNFSQQARPQPSKIWIAVGLSGSVFFFIVLTLLAFGNHSKQKKYG